MRKTILVYLVVYATAYFMISCEKEVIQPDDIYTTEIECDTWEYEETETGYYYSSRYTFFTETGTSNWTWYRSLNGDTQFRSFNFYYVYENGQGQFTDAGGNVFTFRVEDNELYFYTDDTENDRHENKCN